MAKLAKRRHGVVWDASAAMLTGHGIDIVHLADVERLLSDPDDHFARRCFTAGERAAALKAPHRGEYLAGRFAAKEAVLKALGTGFGAGIGFADVEIETLSSGAPHVTLHGGALRLAESAGIGKVLTSISHSGGTIVASAIASTD